VEEVRFTSDEHVKLDWEVLTPLKAHKTIESESLFGRVRPTELHVKQHRLAPKPRAVTRNGLRRDAQLPADLAKSRTSQETSGDGPEEVRLLEPVACSERSSAEAS
jgi:hypothetical protein